MKILKGLNIRIFFSPIRLKILSFSFWDSFAYYINDDNYKIFGVKVSIAK
ncbi:protein p23 (plasmid) [Borreliella valaisiana VS116]|uniref:Protein p23 n=2 Tax=Borreliella TaxID=64895 RepID=C0R8M8_BORVA|nr:protein p23 [Borreliella valaisiana VS116]